MADILHDFPIHAPAERVFEAVSDPAGLDQWWTKRSTGEARAGAEYQLWFGPEYDWRAVVSHCAPPFEFELRMVGADAEWLGTRVGFLLHEDRSITQVRFHHAGWPEQSEHFRISTFCWAMYLRVLRRYLEHGERVPYAQRLEV